MYIDKVASITIAKFLTIFLGYRHFEKQTAPVGI